MEITQKPVRPGALERLYGLVGLGALSLGLPALWLVWGRDGYLHERLGLIPEALRKGTGQGPRLWMHAASLGEVRVARSLAAILNERHPELSLLVSTMTPHGRRAAREWLGPRCRVLYAPLDVPPLVRRALRAWRPKAMVFLETEIWPAWLRVAHCMGVPSLLLNGRISPRSFPRYLRMRPFFRKVLSHVACFSMISEADAERIRAIGAPAERVLVAGNAKYDLLIQDADPRLGRGMRSVLGLLPGERLWVAGSTRTGEEEILFEAFIKVLRAVPQALLVVAPRHVKRAGEVLSLALQKGLSARLWSRLPRRGVQVVVLDTFGELFPCYGAADVAFCGGSLVPKGGQNPLEPAAWGKPVLVGPSMEDFKDAVAMLEGAGAAQRVRDASSLAEAVIWAFQHEDAAREMGWRGRGALFRYQGAAQRHVQVLEPFLKLPLGG